MRTVMLAFLAIVVTACGPGAEPENVNWAVKAAYAVPLLAVDARSEAVLMNRERAISKATAATCLVVASSQSK